MNNKKQFGDRNKNNSMDRKAEALKANLLRRKQFKNKRIQDLTEEEDNE